MKLSDKEKEFILSVYQRVSFYSEKIEECRYSINKIDLSTDWEKLPLVTKDDVLRNYQGMLMPECIPRLYRGELFSVFTSGYTGHCMQVYWSVEDCKKSLLPLWVYRKKDFSISPQDRHCYFYSDKVYSGKQQKSEQIKNQLGFSKINLTENRLKEIYYQMLEFEPVWLILQPVIAVLLHTIKKKYNLPNIKTLSYIEMTGEMLSKELREKLERTFHCRVANQYGIQEANSIAYECSNGNLHCMDENVMVEILDEHGVKVGEGVEGDIYITSLRNRVMPFIRYRTGDRGYISKQACTCGRTGSVLHLTDARVTQWIRTRCGRKINPYVLLRTIEITNRKLGYVIMQFQVIQKDYDKFLYKLVLEEKDFQYEVKKVILNNVCETELQGSCFLFEFCDCIFPEEKTGKLSWFVSEIG